MMIGRHGDAGPEVDLGDEMTPSHQAGQRAEVERSAVPSRCEQQSVRPVRAALHRVEADEAYNTRRPV